MHLAKIQHIIKFIEQNSHKNISSKDLESISNSSYRNLQRIFKRIFKESLGEFQKRLKLENAYKKIIYTNTPVSQIAFEVGFESVQSFSKSFKKQYGKAPSIARETKIDLFEPLLNTDDKNTKQIKFEIIYLQETKVFFKTIKTNNYNNNDINKLWAAIDKELEGKLNINYYGVIVDEPLITEKSKCRYEACVDKEIALQEYSSKIIFGGKYAKFLHFGNYNTIENTYRNIYHDWLLNSSIEFDNTPIIEYYKVNNANEHLEANFITEILIPIKKK